ncbi:P-loop ATPase [Candidatus Woesearchaeota archaeon]|mgnify:CR=1 FL=1|nr:ATP-binding protein [Candidatus Woesearchaeota archaeon]RLE40585.1 MAG: P-loop ATPase [Candidatus Woesearchaeota archaeon]
MKTITVSSGKGGVGKSSITAIIALYLARKQNKQIVYADCDVDAPNAHILLNLKEKDFYEKEEIFASEKATLIAEKCIHCRKCVSEDICNFNAISWNKEKNIPEFNKYLCEGCGSCSLICPAKAIVLKKVKNATLRIAKTSYGFPLVTAQLEIGESGSGKIVTEVRKRAEKLAEKNKADLILIDGAPGIGCPVIASIQGTDYIVAVTEPTPAALHDLSRLITLAKYFQAKTGIIINKYDLNLKMTEKIETYAKEQNAPLLAKIPYDERFIKSLVWQDEILLQTLSETYVPDILKAIKSIQSFSI